MSSLVTSAAPINNEENNNNMENNQLSTSRRKNQTYKNKESQKKLSKNMLEELYQDNDDKSESLGDFTPTQQYNQPQYQVPVQTSLQNVNYQSNLTQDDSSINSKNAYDTLDSTIGSDYYKQYNQNYNNIYQPPAQLNNPSIDLLKKLDNILHILEEQREEQTHLITEELILYIFLGVFVIYVLDSFVRAGKYVR
jgi:hypothetical protein